MLPSALATSEVISPGRVGTASGVSPVTVPRADSVSAYSRVGVYGEDSGAAATMNLVASAVAATSIHMAPCHGESGQGAGPGRGHRAAADPQDRGHVALAQIEVVLQREHLTLTLRQLGDSRRTARRSSPSIAAASADHTGGSCGTRSRRARPRLR